MIEKLGITKGPWEVNPLEGKYYGTEVKIGDSFIKIWGNRSFEPSTRELERYGIKQYGNAEAEEYEITCDGHYEDAIDYNNAKVIAAAPEMLEALITNVLNEKGIDCDYEISIIEKATGKTWEEIKELI